MAEHSADECEPASPSGNLQHCPFCSADIPLTELESHFPCPSMPPRFAGGDAPLALLAGVALDPLTPRQIEALRFVNENASKQSDAALARGGLLHARVAKLGFTEAQLAQTLHYIRDRAPLIIHVSAATLALLARDTHYRNQFETGTSRGALGEAARNGWEDALFGGAYHFATAHEKPKYGVLNTTSDGLGVRACAQYGAHHLVLKPSVRARATFAPQDSGGLPGRKLATCQHYGHVLNEYSDEELRAIISVAAAPPEHAMASFRGSSSSATRAGVYKEAQIHGAVELRRDVEAVVVNADPKQGGEEGVVRVGEDLATSIGCALLIFGGREGMEREAEEVAPWRCEACGAPNPAGEAGGVCYSCGERGRGGGVDRKSVV